MQKQKVFTRQKSCVHMAACLLLLFFLQFTAFSEIMVIKGEPGSGTEIPNSGHYSFDKIAAKNRCNPVLFTVVNNGEEAVVFTGEKITLINAGDPGELNFALNMDELNNIIQPGGSTEFTLQYISTATDGLLKKSLVTLSFADDKQPYVFYVSCIAKTRMIVEFTEIGTHYWKSPQNGIAEIVLIGSGAGGGSGGRGSDAFNKSGGGGGGGGAGQLLTESIEISQSLIYTINIGIYGIGAPWEEYATHGGDSSITYNTEIIIAHGGSPGSNGSREYITETFACVYNTVEEVCSRIVGVIIYHGSGGTYYGKSSTNRYGGDGGRIPGYEFYGYGGKGGDGENSNGDNESGGENGGSGYCSIKWIGFLE